MVCLFAFTLTDSFTFSSNNCVCLCLSIHVSILTTDGFAIKKWNYHQPLSGGQSISREFAPVLWDSSLRWGRKEGKTFSYRQKKIFKSLFAVPGPLHVVLPLCSYWITPDVVPCSFLPGRLQNSQVWDCKVESAVEDHSSSRFKEMVIVNTQWCN